MSVPISQSASPIQLKIERLEDDLRLIGKCSPQSCKKSSQNEMQRNGVGKRVFKLAPPEHEQLFDLAARDLCEPSIPDDVLRQIICQASHLAQNRTANV